MGHYPKIAQLKTPDALRRRLRQLDVDLPLEDNVLSASQGSPLAGPATFGPREVGNRWAIHPMEGWDARKDGSPSDHTIRRWRRFGESGAKLIWGGEAAAVRKDGRANPRQTLAIAENRPGLVLLREELVRAHRQAGFATDDLVVGLQLTHSGRFCRPNSARLEPRIAYHHPLLDAKFGIDPGDDGLVWTDEQLETLIDDYVQAAHVAQQAGFDFVDVKACHGYLLHEFLSAYRRPGPFGGDLLGRTRLLRRIVERIHDRLPRLSVAVRMSVFDTLPYGPNPEDPSGPGVPMSLESLPGAQGQRYRYGFGVDPRDPMQVDLSEPLAVLEMLRDLDVVAVNISCGSPYYNPHIQRPAIFPPSDGYQPPEDPLVGVARQITVARACQQHLPDLPMVGSGYTYLQEYLPHVAQAVVRNGWIRFVGLGRMVLSYPRLPADSLLGRPLARRQICRTFSDCTTGPRHGLVSGCYPLDPYYKQLPEAVELKRLKGSEANSASRRSQTGQPKAIDE